MTEQGDIRHEMDLFLPDEAATEALGARLARVLPRHGVIFLHGELGAGKTTLVRGLLRALGHAGAVKSPTYTLVETYAVADWRVSHFDLYRLGDPEELEMIGIRDYLGGDDVCFIEWPEKGQSVLPEADLHLFLAWRDSGRRAVLVAGSPKGRHMLGRLDVM